MRGLTSIAAGGLLALAAIAPAAAADGNATRGEQIYGRCTACHSLDRNRTGPRHCGLFGRRAGSLPDFEYSPAMRSSSIVWNQKTLERFLAAPTKVVPGTSMGYAGVDDPRERADLIAYLRSANGSRALCP